MKPLLPRVPLSPRELGELAHLVFEWPVRQSPRLALPFFILVAAIMQAGMLLLFSISYKAPAEILPTAPQVYFLPPDSAAAVQLAPWLEANDPSVFSPLRSTQKALPPHPPLRYRPSYEEPPPPLRPLPAEPAGAITPPLLPLTGIIPARAVPAANDHIPRPKAAPTTVQWMDALAGRIQANETSSSLHPLGATSRPSLYQVGISPEGIPLHCVLLESSDDPASDEAARIWIMARRFQPAEAESWGRVLILWGSPEHAAVTAPSKQP